MQDNNYHTPSPLETSEPSSQHTAHNSEAGFEPQDCHGDGSKSKEQGNAGPVSEKGCEINTNAKTELSNSSDLLDTGEKDADSTKANLSNGTRSPTKGPPQPDKDEESEMEDEEDEDDFEAVDSDEAEERGMVQTHGLGSRKYNLQIEIDRDEVRLMETEDNRDLFRTLKDCSCLISMRHLPQVIKWLEVSQGYSLMHYKSYNMFIPKHSFLHLNSTSLTIDLFHQCLALWDHEHFEFLKYVLDPCS